MLGLLIRTPMTVMTIGFTVLFPVVFASNIMVEPATMPDWLRRGKPDLADDDGDARLMARTVTAGEIGLVLVPLWF